MNSSRKSPAKTKETKTERQRGPRSYSIDQEKAAFIARQTTQGKDLPRRRSSFWPKAGLKLTGTPGFPLVAKAGLKLTGTPGFH